MRKTIVILLLFVISGVCAQTKIDYYNNVLAPKLGRKPLSLPKGTDFTDRKRAVLDLGNVWARISNGATLGYDRWGLCYEYPAKSGFTYRWTMAPLIGAKKRNGTKMVASGTRGAARYSEEEFQPLPGFDAGLVDETQNIGFALSDIPASWPAVWPNTQPLSALPPVARKLEQLGLSYPQPPLGLKGFPGVVNGDVRATREGYFVVTDNDSANGNKPMAEDIRVDLWALQWDDILNQNFIVYKMLLTNVGTDTLFDVYIGIHDDPDCPEQGTNEWMDDYAAFIAPGTNVPGYDTRSDSLLWNFSYLWDGDDKVEGLIPKNVGWVGLKFLETPINPATGIPRGITTLQVFPYDQAPQDEASEYNQLAAGIMPPKNVTPASGDWTKTPNSFGPDITYVVASGPFTLAPGQQLNFGFASIHAAGKADLFNNAILCQLLYNANYQAAESPPEPLVRASVADRQVTLYWDDRSEKGIYPDGHVNDRLTRTNAFQGYQIFKSTDRGVTWGDKIYDPYGVFKYWRPIAQFDLADGITGESHHELGRFFLLGDDTGLRHTFIDNNVNNGYEYWYAVCAYDGDDGAIPPLINSIKADRRQLGGNTLAVVPAAPLKGVTIGNKKAKPYLIGGRSTVELPVTVLDPEQVTGQTYTIAFDSTQGLKRYTITRSGTGDTVRSLTGIPYANWPLYDPTIDNSSLFDGLLLEIADSPFGIREGFQTFPTDAKRIKFTEKVWEFYTDATAEKGFAEDFEMIFTDTLFRETDTLWSYAAGIDNLRRILKVPFYLRNARTHQRIIPLVNDGGDQRYMSGRGDMIGICNYPYDTVNVLKVKGFLKGLFAPASNFILYKFALDSTSTFQPGDIFRLNTNHPLGSGDIYELETVKQTTSSLNASQLDIQPVPNPYVVSSYYETGKFGFQKEIQFHYLPPECTIRIFNVAGDLVRTLYHSPAKSKNPTIESWDLQSYNGQEVAYGVYIFHVEVPGVGNYVGKLAIIK